MSSFECIESGVTVVDHELCLVSWNQYYETLFDYPKGFLKKGLPMADIMRFNRERGLLDQGDIDGHIDERLSLMAAAQAYRVIRFYSDDRIIEIKGIGLPNKDYVTTYDDITQQIIAQRQLEDANQNLEQRVLDRTQTIAEINNHLLDEIARRSQIEKELRQAKKMADEASASKTKFLALASHDIMQPLNAASLYAGALAESKQPNPSLIHQLKQAIQHTESIISSLLEISKVDNGAISPRLSHFSLDDLLSNLISEAMIQRPRSLDIRYCFTSLHVISDKHYLRRIIQNLISNAVKYTQSGKVLVGCRRKYNNDNRELCEEVEICILDNGSGISEQDQLTIFEEFYRSARQQKNDYVPGIGLGLSVVKRFSDMLGHNIKCRSQLGQGSFFSITVPVASANINHEHSPILEHTHDHLAGLTVLYIDDDAQNLLATSALLEHWFCIVKTIDNVQAALEHAKTQTCPRILLVDYQLGDTTITGIDLAKQLMACWRERFKEAKVSVCVVSAANQDDLSELVAATGFEFLSKPIKPAKLRALLTQFRQRSD